jgi:DNA-binding NtrC family response regulator
MKRKANILVVDDEECIRNTFGIFLADEGHDATTACNYREGLAALDQKEFNLIIVDIILGDGSGLDLVPEIKKRGMNCKVIIITGAPSDESASYALKEGIFKYIPKPVRKDELLRVVNSALS